jgi:hypothetical protein
MSSLPFGSMIESHGGDSGGVSGEIVQQLKRCMRQMQTLAPGQKSADRSFQLFPHHVLQRGAHRMNVFFSPEDRKEYLDCYLNRLRNARYISWHSV